MSVCTLVAACRGKVVRTALLLLLAILSLGVRAQPQPVLVGTVEKIVDGDTIDVRLQTGIIRVRVHGIDTPERGMAYFEEASAAMLQLVQTKEVELLVVTQDRYDRVVARVYQGGMDVGADLIHRGFAYAERRYLRQLPDALNYCELEDMARKGRRGIWRLSAGERPAPWEWRRRKERENKFTDYGLQSASECIVASEERLH